MTRVELEQRLEQRAITALFNTAEAKEEVLKVAVDDALEISEGKSVKNQFIVDYAEIRVKKELKIDYDEEEFARLIKYFENADLIDDDSGDIKPRHIIKVATKKGFLE